MKKGKKIAVVPALERLQHKRESFLKKLIESAAQLERIFEGEMPRPATEITQAVLTPVNTALRIGS
jgi:hypothetical protein